MPKTELVAEETVYKQTVEFLVGPSRWEEEILEREEEILKEIYHSTDQLRKVMTTQHQEQDEKTLAIQEELKEIKKRYEELRAQMLFTRDTLPEVFMVALALMALGFFFFGYAFTVAKTLFLFGILGALAWIVPGSLSLCLPRKRSRKGD